MKNSILFLFISAFLLISCASLNKKNKRVNLNEVQVNDNLIEHIKNKKEENYTIYTFYGPKNNEYIHKQYWRGIIVLDDLKISKNLNVEKDGLKNTTINWHKIPLSNSFSKETFNNKGFQYKKTSLNPNGSIIDAIDLNNDGIVDYMDVFLSNGDNLIIVTESYGAQFLDEILGGRNPYCNFSDVFGLSPESLPGCEDSSGSSDGDESSLGVGSANAQNPYDRSMDNLCEGFESNGEGGLIGGVYSSTVIKPWRNGNGWLLVHTSPEIVIRVFFDDVFIQISREVETFIFNEDGKLVASHLSRLNPDGSHTIIHQTFNDDGSITTDEITFPGDGSTEGHPGWEPDLEGTMAEFCAIWNESKESRPNDISELNERASEERCSIEPDESAEVNKNNDNALTDTCYLDVDGSEEVGTFLAGGACISAAGASHFDYVDPQQCSSNAIDIVGHGTMMIGGAGFTGFECNPVVCRPPDE